jgi:hypothetical protein
MAAVPCSDWRADCGVSYVGADPLLVVWVQLRYLGYSTDNGAYYYYLCVVVVAQLCC